MGVIIPQVVTEDKAGGAQVIDGGLRFDSSKSHNLINNNTRSASSADYTVSVWIKRVSLNSSGLNAILQYETGATFAFSLTFYADKVYAYDSSGNDVDAAYSDGVLRDTSGWYHLHYKRTSGGTGTLYINGVQQSKQTSGTLNLDAFAYNGSIGYRQKDSTRYLDAYLSNLYVIDGQALNPSSFGFTDPLTNTWRPKKYNGTYGTKGFYLPLDGNTPIGQDQSGRGNNWTPVNFGGSNTIEKATGALPILNTDGGGKVARVGVRTDSNASSLVLALPLVGITSDFSNAVNSGTSNKAITNTSVTFSSSFSNFYGGSASFNGSAFLRAPASSDFTYGTGDFTFEGWIYPTTSADQVIYGQTSSGNNFINIGLTPTTNYLTAQINSSGAGNNVTSTIPVTLNTWNHIAVTRQSTVVNLFINGVLGGSGTRNVDLSLASIQPTIGTYSHTSSLNFNGYIQDFRIYKGLAKYTQNFIPASTDPDILPDTPSGVAYSSNVALVPSTDGGVSLGNGSSTSSYLTLASSADFGFGTGDFTVEFFVYETTKVYTGVINPRAFDFGNTFQMILFATSDGGNIRVDYADSALFTSSGTLFAGKWNHIALVRSGTTLSLYINGVFDKSVSNSTNVPTPSNTIHIGRYYGTNDGWVNGFISNFHVVKGTALYTSNFTPPTAPITSVANTKLLCCKSNSSATAFDVSPGSITANGNAVATNFNPFTVNINTQRGQESGYCTLNPLSSVATTLSNGNLDFSMVGGTNTGVRATTAIPLSGKWYYEVDIVSVGEIWLGLQSQTVNSGSNSVYYRYDTGGWQNIYINGSQTAAVPGFTNGDVIGCGYDGDNQQIRWYKNGVQVGTNYSLANTGNLVPWIGHGSGSGSASGRANFGQKPFKFPPPAGFQPLTLANTPRPTIVRPDQYVGVTTYTGNGTSQSINVGFKPDLVAIHNRSQASNWVWFDSVRGPLNRLISNLTNGDASLANSLTSFNSDGFTYGSEGSGNNLNDGFAAFCWKAGGNSNTFNIDDVGYATASASGLTAGTITPTGASVNTKSGFSIITYTGGGSGYSISHGLNAVPKMYIIKDRNNAFDWPVFTTAIDGSLDYLYLNLTNGKADSGGSLPTSTLVYPGQSTSSNYVMYLWAEIPGFSKFGSYTHNNSTDGGYIHLGFRPKLLLIKKYSASDRSWVFLDTERDKFNIVKYNLWPNLTNGDSTTYDVLDILSNGFKIRTNTNGWVAEGTASYIYAAWAETPSFNLYGGQANAR